MALPAPALAGFLAPGLATPRGLFAGAASSAAALALRLPPAAGALPSAVAAASAGCAGHPRHCHQLTFLYEKSTFFIRKGVINGDEAKTRWLPRPQLHRMDGHDNDAEDSCEWSDGNERVERTW